MSVHAKYYEAHATRAENYLGPHTKENIRRLSDQWTEQLLNPKHGEDMISTIRRHSTSSTHEHMHYAMSDRELVERLIAKDGKTPLTASAFADKETYMEELENAFLDNMDEIAAWITDPNGSQKQMFVSSGYGEMKGKGFSYMDGLLQYVEMPNTCLVLTRDRFNPDNDYCMQIKTFYPCQEIDPESRKLAKPEPEPRWTTPVLHETRTYQRADEAYRRQLDHAAEYGFMESAVHNGRWRGDLLGMKEDSIAEFGDEKRFQADEFKDAVDASEMQAAWENEFLAYCTEEIQQPEMEEDISL